MQRFFSSVTINLIVKTHHKRILFLVIFLCYGGISLHRLGNEAFSANEFNKAIVEENKQTISSTNQTENSKLKKNVNVFQITKTIEKPKSKSPSPQKKEKNSPVPSPKKVADIVYNKVINQSPKIKK